MSRKIFLKVSIILILVLLVAGSIVFMYFYNGKKDVSERIEDYLVEQNYQSSIKEKEVLYDWKIGEYYAKVVFKDEPENYYEIYIESNSNMDVTGYNDEGEQITDKNKGKYITDPE